jgi:hypothetical protein
VPLTDGVTVPLAVLEAAEASLGSFCSDHGWSDEDMQHMDNLSAYIARHKATPPAQPAVQEPIGEVRNGEAYFYNGMYTNKTDVPDGTKLYTTPPAAQRPWVGLSQNELDAMFSNTIKGKKLVNYVARAIEAKLKENNT